MGMQDVQPLNCSDVIYKNTQTNRDLKTFLAFKMETSGQLCKQNVDRKSHITAYKVCLLDP